MKEAKYEDSSSALYCAKHRHIGILHLMLVPNIIVQVHAPFMSGSNLILWCLYSHNS
jgi:hypothetical protein